jgi:hypothetical protein
MKIATAPCQEARTCRLLDLAGFTAAAKAGKPERVIVEQTGHKSIAQLRKYVCEGGLFEENAAGGLL